MSEPQDTNEAAGGRSDSTEVLATRPMVGETWHVLYPGATACSTVKIAEITQRTIVFESRLRYEERYPIDKITFVEMANKV